MNRFPLCEKDKRICKGCRHIDDLGREICLKEDEMVLRHVNLALFHSWSSESIIKHIADKMVFVPEDFPYRLEHMASEYMKRKNEDERREKATTSTPQLRSVQEVPVKGRNLRVPTRLDGLQTCLHEVAKFIQQIGYGWTHANRAFDER